MVGACPAGDIVEQPVVEIMVEWSRRPAAVAIDAHGAPFVALLETADTAEVAADAAGEMRELNAQVRQFVEQAAIDQPHRRRHQGKLPAKHPAEIVGIHARPADHARQRMDEHVEAEIGTGFPERPQHLGIERLIVQFGGDDDAREAEQNGAALQLGRRLRAVERGHMRERDETAGMGFFGLMHVIVDGAANRKVGLIEAGPAGQHTGVDACGVHHADMGIEVGQQRIEQVVRITVEIEIDRDPARVALEQARRRVMLLEIDEHS